MKAIRIHEFGGTENLRVDEIETPTPLAGEALIRVVAAGINFADTMLRQNKYIYTPTLPFTIGFEVAGIIESVGDGVSNVKVGQRVLAVIRGGGYAEYAVANAATVVPIPEGLGFGAATALLIQGLTAIGLIVDLKAEQTILIHAAAGGVGSLLVQLAKKRGATVIGTASSTEKLQKVTDLGADHAINYTESDWTEQVLTVSDGKGPNVIIEMVGGDIGRANAKILAVHGTMHVYGAASGENFEILALNLLGKAQTVRGYNLNLETPENMYRFTGELMQLIASGSLEIEVTEFPLELAAQAHAAIEGRKTTGKVVLITQENTE